MAKFWCTPDGTKVFPESDFANCPGLALIDFPDGPAAPSKADAGDDREQLSKLYEAKFGKKPHHSMKIESIRKAVEEQ